ncbi:MAG: hypothetical protein J6S94_06585 [Bacteroidaceae bacterium]|nr:hypothetical protein [Bacteroidaceae bacterium]
MKTLLKITGGILTTIILLMIIAFIAINTDYVQNKALHYATEKLSERLKTDVKAERISINIFKLTLDLHGVSVVLHGKKTDHFLSARAMHLRGYSIELDGLKIVTNNYKPRKNEGKPKRGWFDAGHLDITANLKLRINHWQKDSINASIFEGTAIDTLSGFHINDLHMQVASDFKHLYVQDAVIRQENTEIHIPEVEMQLPSKKKGIGLSYHTTKPLTARVILQDISRLFTPALAQFTLPLGLSVNVSGTDSTMVFDDIQIKTEDEKFQLAASGGIEHLKNKYLLNISFHVDKMTAKQGSAAQIIEQFPIKKYMMKQLDNLGNISYKGNFSILRKREVFSGLIGTGVGDISLQSLIINDSTKYISGTVGTNNLELGKALGMDDIGMIKANANFDFDISKERTAKMRQQLGGKLPMGSVNAKVDEAKYKILKVRNTTLDLSSDGAVAEGLLVISNKILDSKFSFTFTDTNEMHKMKVKPAVKVKLFSKNKKKAKD